MANVLNDGCLTSLQICQAPTYLVEFSFNTILPKLESFEILKNQVFYTFHFLVHLQEITSRAIGIERRLAAKWLGVASLPVPLPDTKHFAGEAILGVQKKAPLCFHSGAF